MYKILIIEDDPMIALAVQKHLRNWGCETRCVQDFRNVMREFAEFDPQLVVLDIALPFYNGYHWCGEIRQVSKVPILLVSSASDKMNIVMAISVGGDDFIAKPFDLDVLTAKIQALLRRAYDFAGQTNLLEHRGVLLNLSDATLTYDGRKIELTRNDFRILQTLMENTGTVVSREALMTKLWETDNYVDENTLTVNVTRLRRKLEAAGLTNFIRTKKGIGYMIE